MPYSPLPRLVEDAPCFIVVALIGIGAALLPILCRGIDLALPILSFMRFLGRFLILYVSSSRAF